jgi:hypothetical protein
VRALYRPPEIPDTGSLRGDLIACAKHFSSGDARSTLVLASLLSEIGREPELRQATYEAIGRPPAIALVAVVERWKERGVIDPDVPVELLTGLIPAVAFRNVVLLRQPLDANDAVELVDRVLLPALTCRP